MIKNTVFNLLSGLLCLLLVACGTFKMGREQEPAVSPVEAAEGGEPVSEATHAPAADPDDGAEISATETEATASPASPETAPTAEATVEADALSGDAVYAEKVSETVMLPACYDFDAGASVVPPDPACDFSLLLGPDGGTIEIYPQAGAQLAYGGVFPEAPTAAQCAQSDAFSGEREVVAPLAAMYVCYRTGEGRTGYLHFTAADLAQVGSLTFDWATFATAGEDNQGSATEPDALSYHNDTFGFGLPLPPTWSGFQTTEQIATGNERPDVGTVCFTFTGHAPFCILKIDVWSQAGWESLEVVPDGYYLAENADFVFAAGPYQGDCVQLDDFQCARRQEVLAILAGFQME